MLQGQVISLGIWLGKGFDPGITLSAIEAHNATCRIILVFRQSWPAMSTPHGFKMSNHRSGISVHDILG